MVTNILSHVIEGHLKTSTENRNNDNLNLARNANTDGLINCLRQPGLIRNHPKVCHRNLHPLIMILVP